MITSSPRTTATMRGARRQLDLLDRAADDARAVLGRRAPPPRCASAAPRRSECTRTTSPRRTCASSEPMVIVCGEITMSMLLILHQLAVGGPVDQRHHRCAPRRLASIADSTLASSELVSAAEHVGAVDVLLDQQLLVGGIAVEHDGVLEHLGDAARAARVALDQLHLVALLERACQAQADVAAAGDHQRPHRILAAAQFRHDAADVLGRGDEEDLVVLVDDRVAARAGCTRSLR